MTEKVLRGKIEYKKLLPDDFSEHVKEYFDLNSLGLEKLEERIKASNNHVLVMMHPFNLGSKPGDRFYNYIRKVFDRRFHNELVKTVGLKKEFKTAPLFIFASEPEFNVYSRIIKGMITAGCEGAERASLRITGNEIKLSRDPKDYGIYLLTTEDDLGDPLITNAREINDTVYLKSKGPDMFRDSSWVTLIDYFRFLNIKSMTATGGFIGTPLKEHHLKICRCLGSFIRVMRHDFAIDISNTAKYKDGLSRGKLLDMDVSIKETKKISKSDVDN